jgi:hypothetical protein
MEKILELQSEVNKLKHENAVVLRERNEYEKITIKQSNLMKEMGEEIIILRNQLDKFLNYKK